MTRLLLVLSLAVAALVAAPAALACSCAIGDPRDMLERSDGAFVGTLVDREEVGEDQALHTFEVEEALKGEIGTTVVVRSHRDGATCGLEVPIGGRVGLVLDREGDEWVSSLCQQVDADELLAAAAPLPAPTGSGPVAFLVGGSFGEHRTIALDRQGRTLAYGPGDGDVYAFAVCPGGDRAVELVGLPWETGGGYAIEVRDLATMEVVATLGPGQDWSEVYPVAVGCDEPDGSAASVFASSEVAPEQLLRLTADGSERIWRGEAQGASFAAGTALVCAGKQGRRAVEVSLETGATRFLARVPAYTGELSRSPGGRYLAGVVYGSPTELDPGASRALVVDTAGPGRIHTRRLRGPYVSGEMLWVGSGRVLFVPTRYSDDRIRLYDTSLRVLSRGQRLWAVDAALHERQLFVLSSPWVLASPRPTGPLGEVNRLPTAVAHTLEAVTDGPEVAARPPTTREEARVDPVGEDGAAVAGIAGAGAGAALLAAFAIRRRPKR